MNIINPKLSWARPLQKRSCTKYLIFHHAAGNGTVEAVHKGHLARGWCGIAYNYYIRKDGTIYIGRPEDTVGGHTTNYNYYSIGICFEGNFEKDVMSDAQKQAGIELVRDIRTRYPDIELQPHNHFAATACPGSHFPFDEITSNQEETVAIQQPEEDPVSAWAKEGWEFMTGIKIFDGTNPHGNVTREMLAVVMYRFYKYMKGETVL